MVNYKNIETNVPYQLGDVVFIVSDKDEITEGEVRSYIMEVGKGKDKLIAYPRCITSNVVFLQGDYFRGRGEQDFTLAPIDRVFRTKEKAEEKAKFFPVCFGEEVWLKALGKRGELKTIDGEPQWVEEKEYDIENSELPSCCASISSVRDILYMAQEKKGLIQLDIDVIICELGACCVDLENSPNLRKIFKELEIDVKNLYDKEE